MNKRLAIVTAGGSAPAILINLIKQQFPDALLIVESSESKSTFLKRRARKIGWFQTLAQLPMQFISKLGKTWAQKRFQQISVDYNTSQTMPSDLQTIHIGSINDGSLAGHLHDNQIATTLVIGTRIFSKATIASIDIPLLNFHGGLTPDYRGLNPGYWSLIEGKPDRFGGTVHFIDAGIDTGNVIAQKSCKPHPNDNFLTYHHTISAQCADICIAAVKSALEGNVEPMMAQGISKQHYHPTIYGYFWNGITKNIW